MNMYSMELPTRNKPYPFENMFKHLFNKLLEFRMIYLNYISNFHNTKINQTTIINKVNE